MTTCVIGDINLVRALGRAGLSVTVVTDSDTNPAKYSRYCNETLRVPGWLEAPDDAIDVLIDWGRRQAEAPVLYYQGDHDLLAVSRHRERLAPHFRFVLPPAELVETLTDKLRFASLAARLDLPTPPTLTLRAGEDAIARVDRWRHFPCIFKPSMRGAWFERIGSFQKALRFDDRAALTSYLADTGLPAGDALLQACVRGGENRIYSYHAYVRPGGEIVGEFIGRKIRTSPREYGLSSFVEIIDDERVRTLGREIMARIGYAGVLKMDFKLDDHDDRLYLLEINPRFNLWHYPAAVAGVDIPRAVYDDCRQPGSARRQLQARPGIRWISPLLDLKAFSAHRQADGLTLWRWAGDVWTADSSESLTRDDPMPALRHLAIRLRRRLRGTP